MQFILQIIVLIMFYYLGGEAAWLLAVPPHYASLFWPSAGLALGFTYLYGYRMLPGVFIGAFVLAVFSPTNLDIDLTKYITACCIGFGSALQAFVGVFCLRKFVGRLTRLADLRSVLSFTIIATLSCFVSSTIALCIFYLNGSLDASGFLAFWEPWFIGDVTGVLVVAPIFILLLGHSDISLKRKCAVTIPVLFLLFVVLLSFFNAKEKLQITREATFQKNVELVDREIETGFNHYLEEMDALRNFYDASNFVDYREFGTFVKNDIDQQGGVNVLGWAPYVTLEKRDAFLLEARQLHGDSYDITMFDSNGELQKTDDVRSNTPLLYGFPKDITNGVLGFDLMSHPDRRDAIENARRTRQIHATEPVRLANQEKGSDKGFILIDGVFKDQEFVGILIGAFQYKNVISQVMTPWKERGVEVIFKARKDGGMEVVYESQKAANPDDFVKGFVVETSLEFANQEWSFCFYLEPDFYYGTLNFTLWYILIFALIALFFASAFLLILTGQAAGMEEAIANKTKELSDRNRFLNIVMDSIPDMVFVKDNSFRIVQANKCFFDKYDPRIRGDIVGTTGLENFPKDQQDGYLVNDRLALEEGLSEVEERITDYKGVTRTLQTKKVRFQNESGETFLLGYGRDITDILSVQKKLATILDTTADGLITFSKSGIVETYNKSCEEIFGYASKEVIGQNIEMLLPLDDLLADGNTKDHLTHEIKVTRKDGTAFPMEFSVAEVDIGERLIYSTVLRDVTERKKAAELSQQIAQIFNNATIEFYIFDAKTMEFVFVNEGATNNMGFSEEELVGERPSEFVPAYAEAKFYDMAEALIAGEAERFEFDMQHVRKDGSKYDVFANLQLTQFDGRPAFIASMLSHDLKAPLRHVSMSASFFKDKFGDKLDDQGMELLNIMMRGTDRMQNMIESLLTYSRVGRGDIELTRVDLNEIMGEVKQNLSAEISDNGARIKIDDLPIVQADCYLMIQLLQNLIQNAIKYRKEDLKPYITVKCEEDDGFFTIFVSDNGIGIEPKYEDKVFQIFQRLHRDNEFEGVGIGLSICQRIVEFHGGRISLGKKYKKGTQIAFTLPKNKQ